MSTMTKLAKFFHLDKHLNKKDKKNTHLPESPPHINENRTRVNVAEMNAQAEENKRIAKYLNDNPKQWKDKISEILKVTLDPRLASLDSKTIEMAVDDSKAKLSILINGEVKQTESTYTSFNPERITVTCDLDEIINVSDVTAYMKWLDSMKRWEGFDDTITKEIAIDNLKKEGLGTYILRKSTDSLNVTLSIAVEGGKVLNLPCKQTDFENCSSVMELYNQYVKLKPDVFTRNNMETLLPTALRPFQPQQTNSHSPQQTNSHSPRRP